MNGIHIAGREDSDHAARGFPTSSPLADIPVDVLLALRQIRDAREEAGRSLNGAHRQKLAMALQVISTYDDLQAQMDQL